MFNKIKFFYKNLRKSGGSFLRYIYWLLHRPSLPVRDDGKRLLHIGCGDIVIPGFINIDARPLPHVHFLTQNLWNLSRFATGSIDFIYMCHVLEHVNIPELHSVLKELFRIVKIGGVLRISVPDFDRINAIYKECNQEIQSIELILMGGQQFPFNEHHSVFNKQYLEKHLLDAGFCSVREWDPATAEYRGFNDWASTGISFNGQPFAISLNLEAVK